MEKGMSTRLKEIFFQFVNKTYNLGNNKIC